jgi:hypothetical protein
MGFFDDLVKIADKGLKAVEDGAVEKALTNGLDKLEAGLDKAIDSAEKVADRPAELLGKAEEKYAAVEQVAKQAGQKVGKSIDGITK